MLFLIRRTSDWDKKPCKEAMSKEFIYIDRRTVKTLKEAKFPQHKHWADDFFASGTNHREENGTIARDLNLEGKWTITINSLDEILKLIDKYGSLMIESEDRYKGIEYSVEIYDDYRE